MKQLDRFAVLLCGQRKIVEKVRGLVPPGFDVHLKFTSSPGFLAGRSLFRAPKLVLVDVSNDDPSLKSCLREFTEEHPSVPVMGLATAPGRDMSTDLVEAGISSCFYLPSERQKVSDQIALSYNEWVAARQKDQFNQFQQETFDFRNIIGHSGGLSNTIERARKIIRNNTLTVLITGETGTGKELLARAIHYNARNKTSPFVDIGCSSLPETLLESELFGHERGAFTDAKERKIGLFEIAGYGTIFLDEIGDISQSTQSKLLKVVENRTMRRLGGVRDIPVRARIIAATSADLDARMQSGDFRKDLFHRLKILPLELPPLRKRVEDIPPLVAEFLRTYSKMYGKNILGVTHHAMQILMDHHWEGNVRELKHTIERAVLLEEGNEISEEDFELLPAKKASPVNTATTNPANRELLQGHNTLVIMLPYKNASVKEVLQTLVKNVLEHSGGNKLRASRILKISRPRLDRILKSSRDEDPDENAAD